MFIQKEERGLGYLSQLQASLYHNTSKSAELHPCNNISIIVIDLASTYLMFIVKFLLVTADLLKCQGKVIKKIVFCKEAFFQD